ncbi:MAG: hypothetical protein Q7U98_13160 [Methylicorpusculum sp.]|uniref:protein YgfX n=1 Tax=Methylicorpusculum sp. TaxID=2713644 RepID=UPI0027218082|nr:protein YgfX [Methylicorpusculum sp.]MDO8940100.1 hypothetical protein [Methylicorpusculum sp.]MDO9241388.1 hypothetical protein [Methylicorpusculum sp.]MDP2202511.1 hypothetical protein [Methylicorpusculum sp.]
MPGINQTISMNPRFQQSLHLQINPSQWKKRFIRILHLLALSAVFLASLSIWIKALLILCLVVSNFIYSQRATGHKNKAAVRYSDANGWQIDVGSGFELIQICPSTVITPWLIVLHYSLANRKHYVPIFCDALETADFRKLLVLLKVNGLA